MSNKENLVKVDCIADFMLDDGTFLASRVFNVSLGRPTLIGSAGEGVKMSKDLINWTTLDEYYELPEGVKEEDVVLKVNEDECKEYSIDELRKLGRMLDVNTNELPKGISGIEFYSLNKGSYKLDYLIVKFKKGSKSIYLRKGNK